MLLFCSQNFHVSKTNLFILFSIRLTKYGMDNDILIGFKLTIIKSNIQVLKTRPQSKYNFLLFFRDRAFFERLNKIVDCKTVYFWLNIKKNVLSKNNYYNIHVSRLETNTQRLVFTLITVTYFSFFPQTS